jgi:putative PEP-CTERM system TPR-repeat lipoprotein
MMGSNDFAGAAVELRRVVNRAPQFTRARFLLGVALAAEGNLSQANQELTTVIDQVPQNMEARQLLAQVRMRLEDPDSALRVLVPALDELGDDRMVNQLFDAAREQLGDTTRSLTLIEREYSKAPDNKGLRLQLAAAYVRTRQGAKALELLRKADNSAPDPALDRLLLAATAQVEGTEGARRKLDQMLAARPDDADLVLTAAQIQMAMGELARARKLLEDALGRNPEHNGLRLALARVQLASGDRAAGVENLTQLRQRDAHAIEARLLLAQLALQRDDAKEAGALIAEAVSGSPRVADTRNAAGLIYLATARYDSAIEHFRAGTEADPSNPMLWLNLGRSQLALEQYEAARVALQRALALQANWLPAEGALTYLELQTGNSDNALKRVDALKTARPQDPGVYILDAEVRAALHQYAEADRALTQAASRQPSADIAEKSYQVRTTGKLPKPTEQLEKWVAAHPEDLRTRNSLAEAFARAGQRQGAVEQYEAMVARQPRDPVALNNLAWLYFETGDRRAVETARRAVALAPDAPAIADTLGWVLVQTGSVNEGLGLLQKCVEREPRNSDMQYHYAAALAKAGKSADAVPRLRTLLEGNAEFASRSEAEELLKRLNKAQP